MKTFNLFRHPNPQSSSHDTQYSYSQLLLTGMPYITSSSHAYMERQAAEPLTGQEESAHFEIQEQWKE